MNAKISSAKTALVLDQPFFGALVCNLRFTEDATCKTAWTDGQTLGFNPAYIDSLSHAEVVGLLAHEVMHCASGHPFRRDGREGKKWNVACDTAINPLIVEAGMALPGGSLQPDATQKGKSAEWIYDRLPDSDEDGGSSGSGDGAPGEVRDSPVPSDDKDDDTKREADWQQITQQAATAAKAMGQLPAGLDRFAKEAVKSRIDWKAALRKFVQQHATADYTWTKPSPRYISQDIYLPAMQSEDMPRIAIGVDTSGSIDEVALSTAKAEILSVMDETSPLAIDVFYADSRVAKHDTFERGEDVVFRPAGGGGTDFCPVFEAIEELEEKPVCLIYITDLCGRFPESETIPTLWVTDTNMIAPFGETIKM